MTQNIAPQSEPAPNLRVIVVDDDPLVCQFLTLILQSANIEVVAEARDGDQIVQLVQSHRPNVVLMDIRMERMSGIDATKAIKTLANPPGVIMMTSFDTEPAILDSVAAGVDGFLGKDFSPEQLISAVQAVARGEGALSPRAAKIVVNQIQHTQNHTGSHRARQLTATLSERELAVVELSTAGDTNAKIAQKLFVSEATIKTQLTSAMRKMQVDNRIQLAVALTTAKLSGN